MIQLAAFDLDGTLMGADHKIRPGVRQAIAQAQAQGVIITLATGRMFLATLPFARALNITTPLICYQGGWIQAPDGDILHRTPLSKPLARAAISLADAERWHTVLYADGHPFVRELAHPLAFYDGLLGAGVTIGKPWAEILAERVIDKVLFVAEPQQIPAMDSALQQHFAGQADIVQSHAMFIEIVPKGVDKGTALAWLAHHFNIPRAAILAAGDQGNDLSMVKWAGVGVAMGNATSAVREAASWIAPPVTEDGAIAIIERYLLHRRQP